MFVDDEVEMMVVGVSRVEEEEGSCSAVRTMVLECIIFNT